VTQGGDWTGNSQGRYFARGSRKATRQLYPDRRDSVNMCMNHADRSLHGCKCLLVLCYADKCENRISDWNRPRTRGAPDVRDVEENHGEALDAKAKRPALVTCLAGFVEDRLRVRSRVFGQRTNASMMRRNQGDSVKCRFRCSHATGRPTMLSAPSAAQRDWPQ